MSSQSQLECVSCKQSFDPEPYGGFCPNCDTPHPDYEIAESSGNSSARENSNNNSQQDLTECWDCGAEVDASNQFCTNCGVDLDDEPKDAPPQPPQPKLTDCPSCDADIDSSASFCPECGSELSEDMEEGQSKELTECPDCGTSVDNESFCMNCGTDLDEIRDSRESSSVDGKTISDSTDQPSLIIAGESFRIEDFNTFGRQNEDSISALVDAAGGQDKVKRISREHLEFNVSGNRVSVTDISRHGTDYNGRSIDGEKVKLSDGDILTLADVADIEVNL